MRRATPDLIFLLFLYPSLGVGGYNCALPFLAQATFLRQHPGNAKEAGLDHTHIVEALEGVWQAIS